MAHSISDRWLWFGAGVSFVVALSGIRYVMSDILQLTELDPNEEGQDHGNEEAQQPEDSIPLHTLKTLLKHPNPSIATSAQGMIVSRFANLPDASDVINKDLNSRNATMRRKARQAREYLAEWGVEFVSKADNDENLAPGHLTNRMEHEYDHDFWQRELEQMDSDISAGALDRIVSRLDELDGLESRISGLMAENERRRYRREAIVLHEGAGRIVEGDIIRPQPNR